MSESVETVSITVNGRALEVPVGELVIEAVGRTGVYVPRFCYHPRMEPVGVCRMCLVEVDGPRGATLQPACYVRVSEGMGVVTDSDKVKKAQDGVLEFLLANHPLDCPVCDKGGECPLQDQAVTHGSGESRFVEEKRHFAKPIEIGALVMLDRERCIQCARCTRFSAEVAGDSEIAFAGRGENIEVAPAPGRPFDSVFSGNTVQICPVGALTAKPYRFSARPWDLDQVESTCTTCAVGCRVAVQSSGNRLTRVLGLDSEPVNQGWLCDKGRFSLDSVDGNDASADPLSSATRIREPLVRENGVLRAASWSEALTRAAEILGNAAEVTGGVGAIGGAALTNEGAFAWGRFVREVLHSENLDAQYGDGLDGGLLQALPRATIAQASRARVLVTLCGDLREELPVLYLRLRDGVARTTTTLVEFAFGPSALAPLATERLAVRPGEAHLVAEAIANRERTLSKDSLVTAEALSRVRDRLGDRGAGVVFVVGRANLAEDPAVIESALRTFAQRYPEATFLPALRRANVAGALDMGWGPGLIPGGGFRAGTGGRDALAQLRAMRAGEQRALLLVGGCLLGNVLDDTGAREALAAGEVVAVTGHGGATLEYCDVVLPASVQHERLGTVTNLEGRVSAVAPKIVAPGSAWSDVAIAGELAAACGGDLALSSVEETARVIEATTGYPTLTVLNDGASDGLLARGPFTDVVRAPFDPMAFPGVRSINSAVNGELAGSLEAVNPTRAPAPSAPALADVMGGAVVATPARDAYALALRVSRRLYDRGVAVQGSPFLRPLVAPASATLNHFDLDRLGLATGDSVRVASSRTSVTVRVVLDDETPRGTIELSASLLDEDGNCPASGLYEPEALYSQVKLATT